MSALEEHLGNGVQAEKDSIGFPVAYGGEAAPTLEARRPVSSSSSSARWSWLTSAVGERKEGREVIIYWKCTFVPDKITFICVNNRWHGGKLKPARGDGWRRKRKGGRKEKERGAEQGDKQPFTKSNLEFNETMQSGTEEMSVRYGRV